MGGKISERSDVVVPDKVCSLQPAMGRCEEVRVSGTSPAQAHLKAHTYGHKQEAHVSSFLYVPCSPGGLWCFLDIPWAPLTQDLSSPLGVCHCSLLK